MGAVFSTRGTILVANEHTSKVVSISYDMVSFSRRYVLIDLTLQGHALHALIHLAHSERGQNVGIKESKR